MTHSYVHDRSDSRETAARPLPAWVAVAALALWAPQAGAKTYYVSPAGDDAWSGTLAAPNDGKTEGPVRTLAKLAQLVGAGDVGVLRAGVYAETLRPGRSGTKEAPITFRAHPGERPVISGADPVRGWRKDKGGIWWAPVGWDLKHNNQIFGEGGMLTEARWPNNTGTLLQPVRARVQSGTPETLTDPKLPPKAAAWTGAMLWCAGGAEWYCWTARVRAYDPAKHTLTFGPRQERRFYTPRENNPYVLMGVRPLLDAPGEWWLDAKAGRLLLIPPAGKTPGKMLIEMKRRLFAIDLTGRSHIRLEGLATRAAGIRTDKATTDIVMDRLRCEYVAHSYEKDESARSSVLIHGQRITLRNSELAYSSGSIVHMQGRDNRLINCYIHHGNYGAKWRGPLSASGRRQVIAWCTVRHSGRDILNIHGLTESLIEHNDLSDAGWLTSDLGLTYGHNTDFGNTVIRYNRAHDNHAPACTMGIYFDHCSHNVIVHDNLVWNVRRDPIRINNPSYFGLVYHNTCWNSGPTVTFDHARRNDLFGTRYTNNILNEKFRLPGHVAVAHNHITKTPGLVNPGKRDFSLKASAKARNTGVVLEGMRLGIADGKPDMGALEFGRTPWRAGHDFANPPRGEIRLQRPRIAYMNMIRNACFELPTLEYWTKTGAGRAKLTAGNGWGAAILATSKRKHATGTSKRELQLTGAADGVEQVIEGLHPNTNYTLSGWLRVSDAKESVCLGVRGHGGKEVHEATHSTEWVRKSVSFRTGANVRRCVVFVRKPSVGPGQVWADNLGLPLTPAGR